MVNLRILKILLVISSGAVCLQLQNVTLNNFENEFRLNFTFFELIQKCDSKVSNISQILRTANNEFSKKLSKISNQLWDLSVPKLDTYSHGESPSFQLLKSRCNNESGLEFFFEFLIKVIQLCHDNNLQLTNDEIKILSKSAASQICSYLELDSLLTMTDNECIEKINDNKQCFTSINNMTGNYNSSLFNILLNLKLEHTRDECSIFLKNWECQKDIIKSCKNSSAQMHEIWMDIRKSYLGCNSETSTFTDRPSRIFDAEKRRFNFTIPELIRVCKSKGIDLKENTKHADFHVFDIFLVCSGKVDLQNFEALPNEVINCMKKHCYENHTLRASFEKIIDSIQFCYNDVDQISLLAKQNLAQSSVQTFCDKMLMGELAFHDSASTHRSWKNCYEKLENPEDELTNFFVLLSVPHIFTQKQCSFYAGFFACARNEFENSSQETKAAIEAVRLSLSNCD
ncbi:uncharacterized protein LOC127289109 [Leptopilina boulardi]|uniref:uncharacterized protein LOC127289109 n=1 Tax=Leptopilina boulardi TaxID=63433 RepID=UPI0021F63ED7|nr:uncharacterized protein LOC127289109 [Leptopilina boulardi]